MLHARIAARAFNTPLLVEPAKATAFLSGLGPRILGRQVEMTNEGDALESATRLPAHASIIAKGLLGDFQEHGEAPYPVIDGIAVLAEGFGEVSSDDAGAGWRGCCMF